MAPPLPNPAAVNTTDHVSPTFPQEFTITAAPGTDIYAAPNHGYVWTAPVTYYKLANAASFRRARVTVGFSWSRLYDQGGLVLAYPAAENPTPGTSNAG